MEPIVHYVHELFARKMPWFTPNMCMTNICFRYICWQYISILFKFSLVWLWCNHQALHMFTIFQFLHWQVFHGHLFIACSLNHLEQISDKINILHYEVHELPTQCKLLGGNWPMKLGSNALGLWLEHIFLTPLFYYLGFQSVMGMVCNNAMFGKPKFAKCRCLRSMF